VNQTPMWFYMRQCDSEYDRWKKCTDVNDRHGKECCTIMLGWWLMAENCHCMLYSKETLSQVNSFYKILSYEYKKRYGWLMSWLLISSTPRGVEGQEDCCSSDPCSSSTVSMANLPTRWRQMWKKTKMLSCYNNWSMMKVLHLNIVVNRPFKKNCTAMWVDENSTSLTNSHMETEAGSFVRGLSMDFMGLDCYLSRCVFQELQSGKNFKCTGHDRGRLYL
jgi:hypothetical protein